MKLIRFSNNLKIYFSYSCIWINDVLIQ